MMLFIILFKIQNLLENISISSKVFNNNSLLSTQSYLNTRKKPTAKYSNREDLIKVQTIFFSIKSRLKMTQLVYVT